MLHNSFEQPGSEAENKSFKFPEEPQSKEHKESMAMLDKLGYKSITDAEAAVGRPGSHPLLGRMAALARKTGRWTVSELRGEAKDNVVHVPETVWKGKNSAEGAVGYILNEHGVKNAAKYLNESELAKAEKDLTAYELRRAKALEAINKKWYHADVKHITEIGEKIRELKRDIAITHEENLKYDHQRLDKAA